MALDAWLPVGHKLPGIGQVRFAVFEGAGWQIYEMVTDRRALVVSDELVLYWIGVGLIERTAFNSFELGDQVFWAISCGSAQALCPILEAPPPGTKTEALSFALALKATRGVTADLRLQDALYVEKISRLLPTSTIRSNTDDDVVFGCWLTGGVSVSVKSFRCLHQAMSWLDRDSLMEVVQAAGFDVAEIIPLGNVDSLSLEANFSGSECVNQQKDAVESGSSVFELAGRPNLADFFQEHIVDIVQNRDRYKALGIEFPSALVLHGPPGCGKTFAVERLIEFLGWPSFEIDASSVASPYIHETSKKVAEVFEKAMQNSPSVLVIDEMEAFLADRDIGSGHHRVEEVAEFLRRIPEAAKNDVLIVAMTNRVDMIDPAILRRGRFDHVVSVDYANEKEVLSLLDNLMSALPKEEDVDLMPIAQELAGRPLSDVTFIVREGARLAARSGKRKLDQSSLLNAMLAAPARKREGDEPRQIGFIRGS